jgi:hypothetical protein
MSWGLILRKIKNKKKNGQQQERIINEIVAQGHLTLKVIKKSVKKNLSVNSFIFFPFRD